MQALSQPKVMARAAVAALLATLAGIPAAATSPKNLYPMWIWAPVMFLCVYMMWSFVFAWHFEYSGRPVFTPPFKPALWLGATLYAVGAGLLVHWFLDPAIRRTIPDQFPASLGSWAATALLQSVVWPLFVNFAPFAVFMRVTRRQTVSLALTVLWAVLLQYLLLANQPNLPPMGVTMALMLRTVVGAFLGVYFYLNGGALLVCWVVLLAQTRLLLDLAAAH